MLEGCCAPVLRLPRAWPQGRWQAGGLLAQVPEMDRLHIQRTAAGEHLDSRAQACWPLDMDQAPRGLAMAPPDQARKTHFSYNPSILPAGSYLAFSAW